MKRITFILLIALQLGCDRSDNFIDYNEVKLDPFIVTNYTRDAKMLYFDEIVKNKNHKNYNNTRLDSNEIDKVLKIIQVVYDSKSPQRDTVFDIYKIHGHYCYDFHSIYLRVNTELPEIKNLAKGVIPTGNAALDKLLATYSINSVETSYGYPSFPWLTITSSKEYNLLPIVKAFGGLPSVTATDFEQGCIGDGDNITMTRNNHSAKVIFSIGRGDCPAGCTYHRYWEFHIENGRANFIRSY